MLMKSHSDQRNVVTSDRNVATGATNNGQRECNQCISNGEIQRCNAIVRLFSVPIIRHISVTPQGSAFGAGDSRATLLTGGYITLVLHHKS